MSFGAFLSTSKPWPKFTPMSAGVIGSEDFIGMENWIPSVLKMMSTCHQWERKYSPTPFSTTFITIHLPISCLFWHLTSKHRPFSGPKNYLKRSSNYASNHKGSQGFVGKNSYHSSTYYNCSKCLEIPETQRRRSQFGFCSCMNFVCS